MKNFLGQPNKTLTKLISTNKQLLRLSLLYSRMKNLERKQDTRKKIQLGGLIKKVGLDTESTAVLLGMLLEANEELNSINGESVRKRWLLKGQLELLAPE